MSKVKTPRMLELQEENKDFCKVLAVHKETFRSFLNQIQRDIVDEENVAVIAPVILGLKHINNVFDDVILFGEVETDKDNKKKKQ